MSSIFPHATFAEDQQYARTIVTFHVLLRGFTAGPGLSFIPFSAALFRDIFARRQHSAAVLAARLLRYSAGGVVAGTVGSGIALAGLMRGKEEIEWLDRSWRILANKGQVEVDWWSLGGAGLGACAAMVRRGGPLVVGTGARMLGGAGLGSLAGTGGYMLSRYGLGRGRYADEPE
ncbi:hypothetical protein B0J12DRAFT_451350 [Macrophomina phaseolina]|uniref:Mitochondrial inner membrane translocase subunit Tim17/Tim22/Tim23/peroxisomal protein PMP24 n=1 Tax=Macrophomina phaseolina TaxID=35725 RepID=A0ABQ8GFJ2_9PEZI|nr:hypothetical protein B0J12DRAFT_451350 [Macrophomina phaseolina]